MGPGRSITERINESLIAEGYPAECVVWVCADHHRHCNLIGKEHEAHACYWCLH